MGRQRQTSGQCTNKLRNTEDCQQHPRLEKAGRTLPEGLGEGTTLVTPRSQTSAPRTAACGTGAAALGNGLRVTWGPPPPLRACNCNQTLCSHVAHGPAGCQGVGSAQKPCVPPPVLAISRELCPVLVQVVPRLRPPSSVGT